MSLIYTIEHTGTQSLIVQLDRKVPQKHCDEEIKLVDSFIYTVEHTGSHSLLAMVNNAIIVHSDEVETFKEGALIHTTYRDPYRTAASWVNRHHEINVERWERQWRNWATMIPYSIVYNCSELTKHENKHHDRHNMHKYLDDGDMGSFHIRVPRGCIDFAKHQIELAGLSYGN